MAEFPGNVRPFVQPPSAHRRRSINRACRSVVDTINRAVSKRGCVCHVTRKLIGFAISRGLTNVDLINIRSLVRAVGRISPNFGYSLHISHTDSVIKIA